MVLAAIGNMQWGSKVILARVNVLAMQVKIHVLML
jgi:hypothetical protein